MRQLIIGSFTLSLSTLAWGSLSAALAADTQVIGSMLTAKVFAAAIMSLFLPLNALTY